MDKISETKTDDRQVQNESEVDPNDMPLKPVPSKVVATGTLNFNTAAIIAEHTQQVSERVQRINERDAVIEGIRTALRQDLFA